MRHRGQNARARASQRPEPGQDARRPRRAALLPAMARWWIAMGVVIVISIVAVWFWRIRWRPPSPPSLATVTVDLDAASVATVQQHLQAVQAAPRSDRAWGRLGGLLRSLEFRREAQQCLETAQRLQPKEPRWPHQLGLLFLVESPRAAIAHFRRAAALCGTQPDAPRLRLARLLAEAGAWSEMEQALEPVLRAEPAHGPALLALAQAAQACGEVERAEALAGRSATDSRVVRGSWSLLATVYQRQGQFDKAREASRKAAMSPPDVPMVDPFETEIIVARGDARQLSDRVQQLLATRRLPEAAALIAQLLGAQAEFAEGWLLLGRLHLLQNDLVQAGQALERHLQLEPQSVQGLFQLGMVRLEEGRFDEAASVFQEATKLKPDFGPAFFNLGVALLRAGGRLQAEAPLLDAIRHSPEYVDSYLVLAELYLREGRKDDALAHVRQAEALNPDDPRLGSLKAKLSQP